MKKETKWKKIGRKDEEITITEAVREKRKDEE